MELPDLRDKLIYLTLGTDQTRSVLLRGAHFETYGADLFIVGEPAISEGETARPPQYAARWSRVDEYWLFSDLAHYRAASELADTVEQRDGGWFRRLRRE